MSSEGGSAPTAEELFGYLLRVEDLSPPAPSQDRQPPPQSEPEHHALSARPFNASGSHHTSAQAAASSSSAAADTFQEAAHAGRRLRPYQQKIFDSIISHSHNDIAVLPTGAGKTMIAFELMLEALIRHPSRTIVFLAPNNALIDQQRDAFEAEVGSRGIHQALTINTCCAGKGAVLFGVRRSVTFATPQSFLNQLLGSGTDQEAILRKLSRISLMVFDECHHAELRVGTNNKSSESGHPYRTIAQLYSTALAVGRAIPRILGLTASPGECAVDIFRLCFTLKAQLHHLSHTTSDDDSDIGQHVHIPALDVLLASDSEQSFGTVVRNLEQMVPKIQSHSLALHAPAQELYHCVRCIGFSHDTLDILSQRLLDNGHEATSDQLLRILQMAGEATKLLLRDNQRSPFYDDLVERLQRGLASGVNKHAIVFVATRIVAKMLVTRLNSDERIRHIVRPTMFVGSTSADATRAANQETMTRFRAGEFNVLVATSVAEEGIDVQTCNFVFRMEPPKTLITMIQSRGRARYRDSKYMVFCANVTETEEVDQLRDREQLLDDAIEEARQMLAESTDYHLPRTLWNEPDDPSMVSSSSGSSASSRGLMSFFPKAPPLLSSGLTASATSSSHNGFCADVDYVSALNLQLQRIRRPGNNVDVCDYNSVSTGSGFVTTVTVDGREYTGQPASRKKESRQRAAYEALSAKGWL